MKAMRITIIGDQGVGKTQLVEQVILPALKEAGDSFTYKDDGEVIEEFAAADADVHVTVLVINPGVELSAQGGAQ